GSPGTRRVRRHHCPGATMVFEPLSAVLCWLAWLTGDQGLREYAGTTTQARPRPGHAAGRGCARRGVRAYTGERVVHRRYAVHMAARSAASARMRCHPLVGTGRALHPFTGVVIPACDGLSAGIRGENPALAGITPLGRSARGPAERS